tara:strand:+ start:245 stop:718 length:474 start_codon:yes stop_codon:yes gene_type:complete
MEIWKSIKGYEDYQVSNLGRVKSLKCGKERIMKLTKSKKGYLRKVFKINDKLITRSIHQLVAVAFLNHTPCGLKLVVDHIDNNKLNNKLSNLQLITSRMNSSKDVKGKTSKYTGVSKYVSDKKWRAKIEINGKGKHLGCFNTELEASNAYQLALKGL